MTEKKPNTTNHTDRRPDCVTEIRMGNTVLVVSQAKLHRMSEGMKKRSCRGSMTALKTLF